MKDDLSVYNTYRAFEKELLPKLNDVQEKRKAILSKKTLFNKRKCSLDIVTLYDRYRTEVTESWRTIYSSDEEYNQTANNIESLLQGNSICAGTDMQRKTEQFFLWLSMSLTHVIMMHAGKEKESVATEESDQALSRMRNMMAKIDEEEQNLPR